MNWYIVLALFPIAWFLQNVLHEASHLLLGWLVEGRVPRSLKPWPHRRGGRFYFASYDCGEATKTGGAAWRHAAPMFMCGLEIVVCVALLFAGLGQSWLWPFAVCAFVDAYTWLWGFAMQRPGTDGAQFTASLVWRV